MGRWVQAVFYGIAPAIMAIIAIAAVKLGRLTNKTDWRLWAISAIILVITAATGAEIALLFIVAGLVMVLWDAPPGFLRRPRLASLALPLLAPGLVVGVASPNTLRDLFLFSSKLRFHLWKWPGHRAIPARRGGEPVSLA